MNGALERVAQANLSVPAVGVGAAAVVADAAHHAGVAAEAVRLIRALGVGGARSVIRTARRAVRGARFGHSTILRRRMSPPWQVSETGVHAADDERLRGFCMEMRRAASSSRRTPPSPARRAAPRAIDPPRSCVASSHPIFVKELHAWSLDGIATSSMRSCQTRSRGSLAVALEALGVAAGSAA
jgi:hypothetical protein